MGFGCNAAGVVGCRIIDSPRERLIAILTNSMVPCNGRFPTLIMLITLFFMGIGAKSGGFRASLVTAAVLTGFILLGVLATLLSSLLLSKTILKGMPSSFTLELPPYRRPQFGKVVVRSIFDRTLFVLARAVCVAAPAGMPASSSGWPATCSSTARAFCPICPPSSIPSAALWGWTE